MKKIFLLSISVIVIQACTNNSNKGAKRMALEKKVDSLNAFVQKMKPGLGELMTNIQLHHEKLWFSGTNLNWKLADFEIGEIQETVEQAKQIEADRPETKDLVMLEAPLKTVSEAIENKDVEKFKLGYANLTSTCNSCHQLNHFEFNVIKTPTAPPVTDQEFEAKVNSEGSLK